MMLGNSLKDIDQLCFDGGDLVITQFSKLVQGCTRQVGHGGTVQIAPGAFKLAGLLPLAEAQKLRSSATTWLETCFNGV